jgi:hypothetical protein
MLGANILLAMANEIVGLCPIVASEVFFWFISRPIVL